MTTPHYSVNPETTAFIIVDPQLAFGAAVPVPGVQEALDNMRRLAKYWRAKGGEVIATRHIFDSPQDVGRVDDFLGQDIFHALKRKSPLAAFHPNLVEGRDRIVEKKRFNALYKTGLDIHLGEFGAETVIVMGLTTPICVGATVDALNALDYQVVLVSDACAAQAMGDLKAYEAHRAALARMRYIFAEVVTTDELIARL